MDSNEFALFHFIATLFIWWFQARVLSIWIAKYVTESVWNNIVGTPTPPHLLYKRGGVGPSEKWVTWGVRNFLLERGDKPVKGGWCRNGGLPLFYDFTVQSYLLCLGGEVRFPSFLFISCLLSWPCKILIQVSIVPKPNFLSIMVVYKKCWLLYLTSFAIHRKINGQFFLSAQARS